MKSLVEVPVVLEAFLRAEEASLNVKFNTCWTLKLGWLFTPWGLTSPSLHLSENRSPLNLRVCPSFSTSVAFKNVHGIITTVVNNSDVSLKYYL